MNRVTGWIGEQPDAAAPDLPVTSMMLAMRAHGPGDTLAMARARADAADARAARDDDRPDPDERAAALVTRGYQPGLINQLSQQLADVTAEAQAEREKIERGARRAEHVMRAHEAGRISAWQIPDALGDEGDAQRAEQLERKAGRLRAQIAETMEMISPPGRRGPQDPLEAATQRAHQAFADVTRAKLAEAQARQPAPPPFAGASRGAVTEPDPGPAWNRHPAVIGMAPAEVRYGDPEITRMLGPAEGCHHCADVGATPAQAAAIHAGAL